MAEAFGNEEMIVSDLAPFFQHCDRGKIQTAKLSMREYVRYILGQPNGLRALQTSDDRVFYGNGWTCERLGDRPRGHSSGVPQGEAMFGPSLWIPDAICLQMCSRSVKTLRAPGLLSRHPVGPCRLAPWAAWASLECLGVVEATWSSSALSDFHAAHWVGRSLLAHAYSLEICRRWIEACAQGRPTPGGDMRSSTRNRALETRISSTCPWLGFYDIGVMFCVSLPVALCHSAQGCGVVLQVVATQCPATYGLRLRARLPSACCLRVCTLATAATHTSNEHARAASQSARARTDRLATSEKNFSAEVERQMFVQMSALSLRCSGVSSCQPPFAHPPLEGGKTAQSGSASADVAGVVGAVL